MFRSTAAALLCLALSACSSDVFLPGSAKVNKAFPPIAEVRVAEEGLRATLLSDAKASSAFERQYASRLELRALTCGQGITVGRFDSIDKVKALAVNRACLIEQDALLLQFLGIRQVGLRLSQPPLRPLAPLGPPALIPTAGGPEILAGYAASAAGVAVLTGSRGELLSVEIPGGKKIATLPAAPNGTRNVQVSPNGRVAAVRVNNSVMFIDTETGSKLWDTSDIKQFYGWLPEVSAALASDGKTGILALIDFETGLIAEHPVALRDPAWAMTVSTSPSRVLVGSGRVFSLIEHVRDGLVKGVTVKEFHLKQGQGVTSSGPTLMLDGKSIVFTSSRELMAVELDSGKETSWATGEYFSGRYAKLSESTLLVDALDQENNRTKAMVFDIAKATLAPVIGADGGNGNVAELAGRTGFIRRGYQEVWFGDTVKAGDPVAIDSVVNAVNLARQLARLEAASGEVGRAAPPGFDNATPASPAFIIPGVSPPPARAAPVPGQDAMLVALASHARIEAVGVYQGAAAKADAGGHKIGNVQVRVRRGKGVILVLSSYEPVRWTLVPEPGAAILAVLLSGYYQSEVVGAGRARVIVSGSGHAYEIGSSDYQTLNRQTMIYTGKGIDAFQGKYEGSAFTVGE